jgi:hypothetical protein
MLVMIFQNKVLVNALHRHPVNLGISEIPR